MSRKKIQTVETWEEFLRSCLYGGALHGECRHHNAIIKNCATAEACPRVKKSAASPKTTAIDDTAKWRIDSSEGYEEYLKYHDACFSELKNDRPWLDEIERSIKGLDATKTLHKASAYWRSRSGWDRKRSGKAKSIDWRRTYAKSCTFDFNQVFIKSIGKSKIKDIDALRTEIVIDIKDVGNKLASTGIFSAKRVIEKLWHERNESYGRMDILYKTAPISTLENVRRFLIETAKKNGVL